MSPAVITVVLTATAVLALWWLVRACRAQSADWDVSATYVVTMGWLYLLPSVFASYTGNKVVSRDLDGDPVLILLPTAVTVARFCNVLLLLVPVAFLLKALRERHTVNSVALLAASVCLVSAAAAGLNGYPVVSRGALTLLVALLPAVVLPSGRGVCLGAAVVVVTLAAASGLLTAVDYDLAISSCAGSYKCGPLGVFVFGIVANENGLALALAAGAALLWLGIRNRRLRVALYLYTAGMVVISGGRTAAVAILAGLVVLVAFTHAAERRMDQLETPRHEAAPHDAAPAQPGSRASAAAAGTVLALALAAAVLPYLTNDPLAFTRRGLLWLIARQRLAGHELAGLGSPAWTSLADNGLISQTSSYSVHNQFLDVLWLSGLLGLTVFVALLLSVVRRDVVIGAVLLSPVLLLGITERPWSTAHFDSTSFAYLATLLAIPAVRAVRTDAPPSPPAGPLETFGARAEEAVEPSVVVAVPSSGTRSELAPLVRTALRELPPRGRVVVGANGDGSAARVRALLAPMAHDRRLSVVPVSAGYSSSRNDLIRAAAGPTVGVVFLDDDINLRVGALAELMHRAAQEPTHVVCGRISRVGPPTSWIADRLYGGSGRAPSSSFVPGHPIFVGAVHLGAGVHFPTALDQTGGEDTALTWSLHQRGVVLERIEEPMGWEDHRSRERITFVRRVVGSTAVWSMLKVDPSPQSWRADLVDTPLARRCWRTTLHVLGSPAVPERVAYVAARALGVALGRRHVAPAVVTSTDRLVHVRTPGG